MQAITSTPLQTCLIADGLSRVLVIEEDERTFPDIEIKLLNGNIAYITALVKARFRHDDGDQCTPEYSTLEDVDIEITEASIMDQDGRLSALALSESQINRLVVI